MRANVERSDWVMHLTSWHGPKGKAQVHFRREELSDHSMMLPEPVLRLAFAEYERRFGRSQSYERMQERGGLNVLEIIGLLADRVLTLEGSATDERGEA